MDYIGLGILIGGLLLYGNRDFVTLFVTFRDMKIINHPRAPKV
jgi:hypothetical protein